METVEGGGVIVLLVSSLDSLTKLYTMSMDVHARFRTESHQQARRTGETRALCLSCTGASPAGGSARRPLTCLLVVAGDRSLQ